MEALATLLRDSPALLIGFTALFGLLVGSFLNVVIYRLPVMMQRDWQQQCLELLEQPKEQNTRFDLIQPPSRCPHCQHPIGALENIPVFSFLLQRGRCRHCNTPISPRYPAIELLSAILSGIVAWQLNFGLPLVFALVLTWALIALSFIDFDQQLLPDDITLPLLWLGLLLSLFNFYSDTNSSLIGATAGYLSLWFVYQVFKLLTGKEGMGYGDFKLLALFGAWLGWQSLPLIIMLSSLLGAIVGVSLILFRGRDRQLPIPFGPYLAIAGWIALLWGEQISRGYWRYLVHG